MRIILPLITLLTFFLYSVPQFNIALAITNPNTGVDCSIYAGKPGPHYLGKNPTSQMQDITCDQYGGVLTRVCAGSTNYIYHVAYCTGDESNTGLSWKAGCVEIYNEQDQNNAPRACNQPAQAITRVSQAFGQIIPPAAIQYLGFGAVGISTFLSKLVILVYSIASIVVLFMFFWASFDWITSSGEKEKLASAQKRILNAGVGIVLLAASFAILKVLGNFTGFTFFK